MNIWSTLSAGIAATYILSATPSAAQPSEMVVVQPGGDGSSCGRVAEAFAIGKAETSNAEYAAFLNAVAAEDDPYHLYSPMMSQHFWGGIVRLGKRGSYRYAVRPEYAGLPATFVSWYSAIRYVNWLHYGKPAKPARLGATEGDASNGAYDTSRWVRNRNAQYWLPSCAEWRQGGFFDPATNELRRYVTGDKLPKSGVGPTSANYFDGRWAAPFPHLLPVATSATALSASGTLGQAGNVLEWVEDPRGGQRLALGGSLLLPGTALEIGYEDAEYPEATISSIGFRVASRVNPSEPEFVDRMNGPFRDFEFVPVGDRANASDPRTGRGRVDYEFEIGKYEISNREYALFLNSVASTDDPHGLFNGDMQTGVVGGINRERVDDRYRYAPKPGWERKPVTYVSWFDLARLANWLHYGRPETGREEIGTTEGDDKTGAYDTRSFPKPGEPFDPAKLPSRNEGARYFIPGDDEWYKAAYYDGEARRYSLYPTKSDTPPKPASGLVFSGANYTLGDEMGEGAPHFVSDVTAFAGSESYYGTRQQAGNVWEWIEDWRSRGEGGCWRCDEWTKGLRGGSFNYTEIGLSAENLDPGAPELGLFVYGARLGRIESGWDSVSPSLAAQLERPFQLVVEKVRSQPIYIAAVSFAAGGLSLAALWLLTSLLKRRVPSSPP